MFRIIFLIFFVVLRVSAQNTDKVEMETFIMEKHVFTKMRVTAETIKGRDAVHVKTSNAKLIKLVLDEQNFDGEKLDAELDLRALIIIRGPGFGEKTISVSRLGISKDNQPPTLLPKKSRVGKALRRLTPMGYGW